MPKCVLPDVASTDACYDDGASSSPGNHIVSLPTGPATCNNALKPTIYGTCAMTADTLLSLRVAGDCSIAITPIGDIKCAEQGAEKYQYNDLRMQAYYATPNSIRSLLPSTTSADGSASSFLLSLEHAANPNRLTLATWEATTDVSATPGHKTCGVEVAPTGGLVAQRSTTGSVVEEAACPDGSYSSSLDSVLDPTGIEYCMPW